MKYSILLFTLILSVNYYLGQEINHVNGKFSYTKVLTFQDKQKDSLYGYLKKWFDVEKRYTISNLKEFDDEMSGILVETNTNFYGKKYSELRCNFNFSFRDNKIKIVLDQILIADISGGKEPINEILFDFYKGKEIKSKKALNRKSEVESLLNNMVDQLTRFIEKNGTLKEDDW